MSEQLLYATPIWLGVVISMITTIAAGLLMHWLIARMLSRFAVAPSFNLDPGPIGSPLESAARSS